jgi:hypothetical protein
VHFEITHTSKKKSIKKLENTQSERNIEKYIKTHRMQLKEGTFPEGNL